MHGCVNKWLARLLTGAMTCGVATAGLGQGYDTAVMPGESSYVVAPGGTSMTPLPPAENYLVSNNNAPEEKDLAAKVKDLEAALKKINDKDKAAKEKAAGAPSVKLSGFLWWDSVWFGQNAPSRSLLGDAQDTTFLSNARLCADGEAFDVGFYKVEIDFANRTDLTTGTTSAHTHTLAGMEIPPNMGQDYTTEFRKIYPALAKENHVSLIPFLLKGVGGDPRLNQEDGIHPNKDGEKIVAENVWEVLKDICH